MIRGVLLACALAAATPAFAVDLELRYTAIEGILAQQVFTQDGRLYVRGGAGAKCDYAYLERLVVSGRGGRIEVRARFSGRTAKGILGRCVGLGDSFDVAIAATPYYRDGIIALNDVRVDSLDKDGYYIRRVRQAMTESLLQRFAYRIKDDARRLLEEKREAAPFRQELKEFAVTGIRATPEALVLTLEFTLVVK